jgi:hypothetical protein
MYLPVPTKRDIVQSRRATLARQYCRLLPKLIKRLHRRAVELTMHVAKTSLFARAQTKLSVGCVDQRALPLRIHSLRPMLFKYHMMWRIVLLSVLPPLIELTNSPAMR